MPAKEYQEENIKAAPKLTSTSTTNKMGSLPDLSQNKTIRILSDAEAGGYGVVASIVYDFLPPLLLLLQCITITTTDKKNE